jgi:hypothetical protein
MWDARSGFHPHTVLLPTHPVCYLPSLFGPGSRGGSGAGIAPGGPEFEETSPIQAATSLPSFFDSVI